MKKDQRDPRFQTHISEPRWQQIASVGIVLVGFLLWLVVALFSSN